MKSIRRLTIVVSIIALLTAALLFARSPKSTTWLAAAGLAKPVAEAETITVTPGTLSFRVETTGTLRATSVQSFGGPPAFSNYWQFQLVSIIPEGRNVKKGEPLLMFDAQRINEDLMRFQNELDQASKELEKTTAQISLERQELTAKLAEAENNFEKLKLKQRVSSDIEASRNIELDQLAVEQARREVEALQERLEWHKKSSDAVQNIIASRKARAENKVAQINQGRANFQAKADRDGVVVYKTKWNGDKFQIGENVWSGQPIIDIPDLNTIRAEAFVPEVDIGKIKLDQRAEITIDAFPGKAYTGKVKKMDTLVRQKAWDIQNKILYVEIELDQLDTNLMRPAMGIKTKIETGALANCLFVPLKAVKTTDTGAQVKVRTPNGWRDQTVKLGEANATDVVILEGLNAGDRVASDYAKVK
ncbi:MAG: efflux RND transporter periplasmic adaptor subunit [Acidobacteria bacterium]|nr:efflux RND transporter periplasmic adaptor subunit [Acidobacteriota bacterium]MBI3426046.1 efflux RND transporter periplasmic adaptor subunit [Acidobacteriota bacterium]